MVNDQQQTKTQRQNFILLIETDKPLKIRSVTLVLIKHPQLITQSLYLSHRTFALMGYVSAFKDVWKEIKRQKRYNQAFLIPYLNELEVKYGGVFSPEQRHKIINYYGVFITSFLCSSYKRLYGQTLSEEERKRATLFGILTPVGDDLFDIDKLDAEQISAITFQPDQYVATTFSSSVAKEIQSYLLNSVPFPDQYLQASANVLHIQAETAKQSDRNISEDELRHITYTKGAVSVIIYHQCLNQTASKAMLETLFYIGSLYQLGNDLFDLFKDVRDHIYTLVNTCQDFTTFRQQFIERVILQNDKIMSLPFDKKAKQQFCIVMNSINARSLVAIDQLIRLQKETAQPIDWWKQPRKTMIVDMEKPANIVRWLYYIVRLPKLSAKP